MDAPAPDRPDERPHSFARRRLLQLAGSVGVASIIIFLSNKKPRGSAPATGPQPPSTPNPAATSTTSASLTSPPPAPVTLRQPGPSTTSALLLCREAWGARPARPGGRPHTITRMTLHHEAVVLGENRNAPSRFRQDQRYHQDQLGSPITSALTAMATSTNCGPPRLQATLRPTTTQRAIS
jgi:hypothetical protein